MNPNEMVALLEAKLRENVGVTQVTTDGTTVQFSDRQKLLDELALWRRQAATYNKRPRSLFRGINLSSAW